MIGLTYMLGSPLAACLLSPSGVSPDANASPSLAIKQMCDFVADPGTLVTSLDETNKHTFKPSFEEVWFIIHSTWHALSGNIEDMELDVSDTDFSSHFGCRAHEGDAIARTVPFSHAVTHFVHVGDRQVVMGRA
jgi:hypothetical protein